MLRYQTPVSENLLPPCHFNLSGLVKCRLIYKNGVLSGSEQENDNLVYLEFPSRVLFTMSSRDLVTTKLTAVLVTAPGWIPLSDLQDHSCAKCSKNSKFLPSRNCSHLWS